MSMGTHMAQAFLNRCASGGKAGVLQGVKSHLHRSGRWEVSIAEPRLVPHRTKQ